MSLRDLPHMVLRNEIARLLDEKSDPERLAICQAEIDRREGRSAPAATPAASTAVVPPKAPAKRRVASKRKKR